MHIDVMQRTTMDSGRECLSLRYEDPLDPDALEDAPIVTTRRSLLRVALVAAETATRFARERIDVDPMAWMLTPRRIFDGRAAIDGCLDRDDCLRGILLHGLSIGLDADPAEIDALNGDGGDHHGLDDPEIDDHHELELESDGDGDGDREGRASDIGDPVERPRLWTSLLVGRCDADEVQAFDAVVAGGRLEAEARLRARHGDAVAGQLEVVEGFDPTLPLVEALVSPTLSDILAQVSDDPGSPLGKGLSVSVRQRFAA